MDVKETIELIMSELKYVGHLLSQANLVAGHVHYIEPTRSEHEHDAIVSINPTIHFGNEALALASEAFSDLTYIVQFSKKSVRRYIGVIQLAPNSVSDEILTLIQHTNTLKLELAEYISTEFTTRKARYDALHYSVEGIFTNQLYRGIHILENPMAKKITFSWKSKKLVDNIDKNQLITEIKDVINDSYNDKRIATLTHTLHGIESCPGELLRAKRVIKANPWARLVSEGKTHDLTASLPIIIIQNEPIIIRPIAPFIADSSVRKIRTDKHGSTLIAKYNGSELVRLSAIPPEKSFKADTKKTIK